MPVLLLQDRCDQSPDCFAAAVCPHQALFYDEQLGRVLVRPERCGDCRGPCLNFCDRYALRYASSMEELVLLQAELDGTMSAEEIAEQRARLQEAREEERRHHLVSEVTAANFQQEVVQARLPALVEISPAVGGTTSLQGLAQQYVGRLLVRHVDSNSEQRLLAALQVRQVPTYLFFYRGRLVDGVTGRPSLAQIQDWVRGLLDQVQTFEETQEEPPVDLARPGAS